VLRTHNRALCVNRFRVQDTNSKATTISSESTQLNGHGHGKDNAPKEAKYLFINQFMTLAEYTDSIDSRKDFAAFARALGADLRDNPETWENGSLERFLEALAAWAEEGSGQQPDWRTVGGMLMAAKENAVSAMSEEACA
jgi:hypothetical protein